MAVVRISAKALIYDERGLLVIQNHNPDLFYTLPDGGQEPGEPLPETLQRECREELRMEIEVRDMRGALARYCTTGGERSINSIYQGDIN